MFYISDQSSFMTFMEILISILIVVIIPMAFHTLGILRRKE
ncbi:hypothetical protein VFMJ11_A0174 [Aliivibrio fischeri MJ11]|uniref:Uncharacterized protein n=1 Tax=Aliivibrio fischeri (strain MJ11) TaxID=388396 RepID=B5ESR3_ALIFM|nr:hypothetical protein VFMJ11_A0174 [Aliivibrio fischeri MJ11]